MHNRYKELSFYQENSASSSDGFDTFQKGGSYYFTYREGGEVLLISAAFSSITARYSGIEAVKRNLEQRERYKGLVNANGSPYLSLRGNNNKEIAISRSFQSQDEMDRVLDIISGKTGTSATTVKSAADKYLPTPAYIGEEGFHSFEKNGGHYFSYNNEQGKPFLLSQAYENTESRDRGIKQLTKFAQDDSKWYRGESEDGNEFFFCLKADPNNEIARSPIHFSEKEMMDAFEWIRGKDSRIGIGSALLGGTLLSASMVRKQMGADLTSNAAARSGNNANPTVDHSGEGLSKEAHEQILRDREKLRQERIEDEMRVMQKRREEEEIRKRREREAAEMKRLRELREKEALEKKRLEKELALKNKERKAVHVEEVKPVTYVEPESAAPVVAERKAATFPWSALALCLLGMSLFFWWQGCDSGLTPPPPPPDTTAIVPATPEPEREIAIITQEEEEPEVVEPRCDISQFDFRPGTIESSLANCLADPDCLLPAKFQWYDTYFKTGAAHMDRTAFPSLDNIAKLLLGCENVHLEIFGHISEDESDVYRGKYQDDTDISLSGIRARCTFRKLEARGVPGDRMSFLGKGKIDPLIDENTQRAYSRNRRSELVLRIK